MELDGVIAAHTEYMTALKQHRNLGRAVAVHIAAALPDGIALEWAQGNLDVMGVPFEVGSPIVFPEKTQVKNADGVTVWVDTTDAEDGGFYIEEGVASYRDNIAGFTRVDLRTLIKVWKALPFDVLATAYGDAIVRVLSNGKVSTQET